MAGRPTWTRAESQVVCRHVPYGNARTTQDFDSPRPTSPVSCRNPPLFANRTVILRGHHGHGPCSSRGMRTSTWVVAGLAVIAVATASYAEPPCLKGGELIAQRDDR